MNIIIPIGGKGDRFLKNGYAREKPLIGVFGKPMILYVLDNMRWAEEDNILQAREERRSGRRRQGADVGRGGVGEIPECKVCVFK
jgi:dTDP-glucose pyrophosphorylase